jgi:hypothetical protein
MPNTVDILIIILQLAILVVYLRNRKYHVSFTSQSATTPLPRGEVTLLKRSGDSWVSFGCRPLNHPDIEEALRTPGLAYSDDSGNITLGVQ